MNNKTANAVAMLVGFVMVVQALPAGAAQFEAAEPQRAIQEDSHSAHSQKPAKNPPPAAPSDDWDPKDPAAVQYSDGAWGIAYNDAGYPTPNLIFRRSLGAGDPQYWRDPVSVETAAESPALVALGSTTAIFYSKLSGTIKEVFMRTSSDDGSTWSSPTQLTSGSPASTFQIQASNVGGTVYLFWSRSDTSGVLQYRTSTDLASWSTAATVGQPIGPLAQATSPYFDVTKLSSGDWAMAWQNVSTVDEFAITTLDTQNDLALPVVWVATASSLSANPWSNPYELSLPYTQRGPKGIGLAQSSSGAIYVSWSNFLYPSDHYIYARGSTDGGVTWAAREMIGFEPARAANGSAVVRAHNPSAVSDASGAVRVFWDQSAVDLGGRPGPYPPQLFRRDLPGGPIVQISVSKDQKSLCGPCVPTGAFVADPINATTGNFTLPEADFAITGKGPVLSFTRTYNAHLLSDGPLGVGWTHNYDERLTAYNRGEVLIVDGTGRHDLYLPKTGGGYQAPAGHNSTLIHDPGGTWTLTDTQMVVKTYSAAGKLVSVSDRNSNSLTLGYDGSGKLTTVTEPSSRALTIAYTGNRISSITDPLSRSVSYGYNGAGDLTSVTDKRSKVWNYTYDTSHRMLTKVDPNSRAVLTNVFTSLDRVYTQTDAKGGVTTFKYADEGGRTDVVDPRANTTTFLYDPNYRVTQINDPYGKATLRHYDTADNLLRIEDRRKNPVINNTYFTYDARGNVLTRKDGLNKIWTYTYNSFNEVLTETDPMNRVTTNTYDGNGNPTSTTNAKSQTTSFGVGTWGQVTSVTDATSKITSFGYDSYGNQTTVTNPLGKVWTTTFDLAGRKTKVTDPLSHETEFAYNANDNLTSVTDARGKVTSFGYDNAGNRTTTTDPNNKVTSFGYDAKNRLENVTDAEAGVTTYAYDLGDNLTSVLDANSHSRSYTYDKNSLQLTEKDALNNTTTFVYDGAGNRTKRTDAKSQITTYAYDTINRLTTTTYPGSVTVTHAYNNSDAQTSMIDSTGTTTYTLDELYRPSSITMPGNKVVGYLYDLAGNRTRITYPDSKQVNYTYDDAGRMDTVTDWASGVTDYDYDFAGRLTTTTLPNGVVQTSAYNITDQLTDITAVKGGNTLTDFGYTLDDAGMRTAVQTPAGLESYTYDDLYRLTGVTYPDTSTQAYTYDNVGNRQTKVEGSTTSYTYNNADRMTTAGGVTYTYDNNGNQTGRGADVFGWDIEDRLTSATVGGNAVSYTYRGDDLRHSKIQDGVTTVYTWDLAAGLPVVLQEGNTSYVYGLGLISQTTGSTSSYPLADGLGSTSVLTDASGSVTATYAYDVFGAVKSSTGPGSTEFRFAGQQDDPALGYQYLRARYYDPATGRFLSVDPLVNFTNAPFTYANNNPVNLKDPTGEVAGVDDAAILFYLGLTAIYAISSEYLRQNPQIGQGIADGAGSVGHAISRICNRTAEMISNAVVRSGVYGRTPAGRPFTRHYGEDTGPVRNIPGSLVDHVIDTTPGKKVKDGKTVHYDPENNVTVVTGDGDSIVSARKGKPGKGEK